MDAHTTRAETQAILDSIRTLVRALRVSSRTCEAASGRTSAQIFILERLAERGRLSVNELADATFTHQSTVSVVVGRLVRDGLVARRPARKDGRRIELSLTPKGWRAYERSPRAAQNEVARAIQSLPAAKRRAFGKTFHDLMSEAGFAVSKPPLFFEETPKGKGNRP